MENSIRKMYYFHQREWKQRKASKYLRSAEVQQLSSLTAARIGHIEAAWFLSRAADQGALLTLEAFITVLSLTCGLSLWHLVQPPAPLALRMRGMFMGLHLWGIKFQTELYACLSSCPAQIFCCTRAVLHLAPNS